MSNKSTTSSEVFLFVGKNFQGTWEVVAPPTLGLPIITPRLLFRYLLLPVSPDLIDMFYYQSIILLKEDFGGKGLLLNTELTEVIKEVNHISDIDRNYRYFSYFSTIIG